MRVPRVQSVKTLVQKCSAEMVLSRYHEGRAEMIRLYTGSEPSQSAPSRPKCT